MRRKRIFAAGLLLLLAGAAGLWLFAAATAPSAVQRELARVSGARVRLGRVERSWLPPGVLIREARFETPAYALEVDQLEVRLSLPSLLAGRGGVGSVVVNDARLELSEGEIIWPELPPDASWEIRRVEVRGPVGARPERLFYLDHARLEARGPGRHRLELAGGPSPEQPAALRLTAETAGRGARGLPDGRLELTLDSLPAQPLLGFLVGEARLLGTANLHGRITVTSKKGAAAAEGSLRASAPDRDELAAGAFRLRATPDDIALEEASGHFVGNRYAAAGKLGRWRAADREGALELRLREARLEDDTLHYLHEVLGREALGFAENLRGEFSAEMRYAFAPARGALTGHVELGGLTAAANGFPPVRNLRGRLHVIGDRLRLENVTGRLLDAPARIAGEIRGRQLALRLTAGELPLERLPAAFGTELPVSNLTGDLRVAGDLTGDLLGPTVAGEATLAGAGFDFRGVEVRELEGEISFGARQAHFDSVEGRAGDCRFEAAGRLEPRRWQETLEVRALAPACALAELLRLGERAGFGSFPFLAADSLEGAARVSASYQEENWEADVELDGARWSPPGLALPVEDLRGRLRLDADRVQVRPALRGRLGASPLLLRGQVSRSQPWELELETTLADADAERLLPETWQRWVRIPSGLEGRARLQGAPDEALAVEARLETPSETPRTGSNGNHPPAPVSRTVELEGRWAAPVFELSRLRAQLGAAELTAAGEVRWGEEKNVAVRLRAPAGTPVGDLLALARLPDAMNGIDGAIGLDLRAAGPPDKLAWNGSVDLAGVGVPGLLTKPVRLTGHVAVSPLGLELEAIDIQQPLGRFTLSGLLRAKGRSTLQARGAWLNLDRLLHQLPQRRPAWPADFLARHPLEVALSVDQVRFLDLTFTDVRGTLEQTNGEFRLRVPAFGVGKGTGRLQAALDTRTEQVTARVRLRDIPAATLLADVLKMDAAVEAPLALDAELIGPLGSRQEFLRGARGQVDFTLGQGRIARGTLPERLFALAVLVNEGFYGLGVLRLARLANPPELRRFHGWTGTVEFDAGRARLESDLTARIYDLHLTGGVELASGALELHGDGDFHPGWQPDLSLKSLVDGLARLLRPGRKRGKLFEFDIAGELGGRKRVQNFAFK